MGRLLTRLKSIVSMLSIFRTQANQENDHMTMLSFDLDNINRIRAKNGKAALSPETASDVAANAANAGVDIEQALTGYVVVEAPFGDAPGADTTFTVGRRLVGEGTATEPSKD